MAANGIRPTHNLEPFMDQHARSLPEARSPQRACAGYVFGTQDPRTFPKEEQE
jgi:hypothetical protein